MIQDLLAWLPLHAYLSLCHSRLCTLVFIRTVLVEKTQPKLLHGLVGCARSRSAYHLSNPYTLPPPNSPSPLSPSISLSHPVLLPILPITPQWVFFSSLTSTYFFIFPPSFFSLSLSLSLTLSLSLSLSSLAHFLSQSFYPTQPSHPHLPHPLYPSPPRLLRAPPH